MVETTVTINHPIGLHARPAALFYKKTREFKSKITIQNLSRPAGKEVPVSAFYLLQIGVAQGHQVHPRRWRGRAGGHRCADAADRGELWRDVTYEGSNARRRAS